MGKPWILEGKMFFPVTGIPILKNVRIKVVFAVALPDPLTVLKVMTKSLMIFGFIKRLLPVLLMFLVIASPSIVVIQKFAKVLTFYF